MLAGSHPPKIDLIGLGCGLGLGSPDSHVLLRLKASVLEIQTESTHFEHTLCFLELAPKNSCHSYKTIMNILNYVFEFTMVTLKRAWLMLPVFCRFTRFGQKIKRLNS